METPCKATTAEGQPSLNTFNNNKNNSNNVNFFQSIEGRRNDFISGGARFNGLIKVGERSEFCSSVLATASFGIQTNGNWSFIVPPSPRNVLNNNMSL